MRYPLKRHGLRIGHGLRRVGQQRSPVTDAQRIEHGGVALHVKRVDLDLQIAPAVVVPILRAVVVERNGVMIYDIGPCVGEPPAHVVVYALHNNRRSGNGKP